MIQAILLIIGSCLLTYFAFEQLGGGWSAMMDRLDGMLAAGEVNFDRKIEAGQYIPQNSDEVFSLVRPANDKIPWWSLLTGVPLLGFYF